MVAPVTVRGRELRALAAIVSEHRPDLSEGEGLPSSLLADLMSQVHCDASAFAGFDSGRQSYWFGQVIPSDAETDSDLDRAHWEQYWDCQPCSYPDRTGDLRSVLKIRRLLLSPAVAFHRHVLRPLSALGDRA